MTFTQFHGSYPVSRHDRSCDHLITRMMSGFVSCVTVRQMLECIQDVQFLMKKSSECAAHVLSMQESHVAVESRVSPCPSPTA